MANAEKELEDVLLEVGNRLLTPPSAVDELLPLLDQAEALLSRVEQSPSQSMSAALCPAMKALTSKELLGHSAVDVKVAVASSISEITRITAPEAPYDDDLMKEIFQMIVESFEKLDDMQNRSYAKRVSILETVAKVRSCVVMLDLECDTLILEMFHHFLKTIRDSHPGNVFSSMVMIMSVVLEESEDISPDILSCLLTCVKKNSKDTLEISRRLAENVISNCALKLKPCLGEVVQSLGAPFDDYSEIVALVCQKDSDQLVHSSLNVSGECLADDSKLSVRTISGDPLKGSGEVVSEVACSEGVGNEVDKSSSAKTVVGNGTVKAENFDCLVEPMLSKDNIDGHRLPNHMAIAGVGTDEVDTTLDLCTMEAGVQKSNSSVQPPEDADSSQIDRSKEAVESLISSKGSNREIGVTHLEAAASEAHTKIPVLQASSEKSPNDNRSMISSAPRVKISETGRPKRGRPPGSKISLKKGRVNSDVPVSPSGTGKHMDNEHTTSEEVPSVNTSSKKQNEGISDQEPVTSGCSAKKGPLRNADNVANPAIDSNSNLGDSERKPLRRPGKRPQMEKAKEGGTSGKDQISKTKQRKSRVSSEKNDVAELTLKEKVSSLETDSKVDQDEIHVVETPKMKSPRKRARQKEAKLELDESLVGAKIKVWWPDDKMFYPGVIGSFDPVSMRHRVLYVDGDEEDLLLKDEVFQFIKGDKEGEDQGVSTPVMASEMSRKKAKMSDSSSKKSKVVAPSKGGRGSSAGKGSGGRAESNRKRGVDATKSISGRSGSGSKSGNQTDGSVPTGSNSKAKAGNRSSFDSPKVGSASKDVLSKTPTDASPKTTTRSKHGASKAGSKAKDEAAKLGANSQDDDAKASSRSNKGGQTPKGGSTSKSGRPDSNGSTKRKVGSSKGHKTDGTAFNVSPNTVAAQDSGERSGKKRKR